MSILFGILRAKSRSDTSQKLCDRTRVWRILATIACAFALSWTMPASAACSFKSGGFTTDTIDMGNITVASNVAIGSVIASRQLPFSNLGGISFTCGPYLTTNVNFFMSGADTSGIYPTNIPGIGIRIYVWANQAYYDTPTSPALIPNSWSFYYTINGAYGTGYLQLQVDLVATGPIGSGNTLSYGVAPWMTVTSSDGQGLTLANLNVTAAISHRSCSVTTSSVTVNLPTAFVGNLNTGSTGATPFNLGLNCAAGTKVNVTLTDASDISNTSTILSAAPGSTSGGIGLQILSGSTPVAYGPDSATVGNTNQWLAGTATGGPTNIPLTVQYVRTSGELSAGAIKGLATFTMSYQ